MSARLVCLQCGAVYGLTTSPGDSHGLCGAVCQREHRRWMVGDPLAVTPAVQRGK